MDASSDRACDATSELVHAIEDALALLRRVFAEKADARANAVSDAKVEARGWEYNLSHPHGSP